MLVAPGFVTHLDLVWDLPPFEFVRGLARRFRVIVLDKRGTGLSDRSLGFGSVEDRTEDIRAVLDAVGSKRPIIYGISESGPMAVYFAASQPERVRALILYGTFARLDPALGFGPAGGGNNPGRVFESERFLSGLERDWGKGIAYQHFLSHAPDPVVAQRVLARYERSACTPQMCREIMQRNLEIDVASFLSAISVPTLVLHCSGDPVLSAEYGRYLGRHIPAAKYVEVEGDFHGSWRLEDMAKLGTPIVEFLSDVLGEDTPMAESAGERELATVLFTDIVGSTERAAEIGDSAWKSMLGQHESSAAEVVAAAGGRMVKTTGDGILATFAGPSHAVTTARTLQDAGLPLGVGVRAGLHTGEIERRGDDIGGIAVHITARIAALAQGGEILASRTARNLAVGSRIEFEDRGTHALKGVPDKWQLFAVH